MNLAAYRNDYYALSGKASDVARQLTLAGIALIWIFKIENKGPLAVPHELLLPAATFVAALALDLLQYTVGALVWGAFSRFHERKGAEDTTELLAPKYFNWPAIACFWSKLLLVFVGYWLVLAYIAGRIGEP